MTDIAVWGEPHQFMIHDELKAEAARLHRIHQLPTTLDAWQTQRAKLRERIWTSLGARPDHNLALDLDIRKTIPMDGYQVQCVTYQSRPGMRVTGNLYVPDGKGPFPGVVGVHGHWAQGRLSDRVQSRGHTLAKNGYVCLNVDAFGAGERSDVHGDYKYHGGALGFALFDIGETLMGCQVVDNMRAVDALCSLDVVDSAKIGATGASGGGNQTMWLAAMDDRVTAAMPVVSVGTFESYIGATNCVCEVLPDGLTFTEESAVLALTAPRALKICNALKDANPTFFPSEMLRSFVPARAIYQLHNEDSRFSYQVFNLPHGYWPEVREAMLGWFDRWLKGEGDGQPRAELPFKTLEESDVMCFPKGKRPADFVSIAGLCQSRGKELCANVPDGMAPEDKRRGLRDVLRMGEPLKIKQVHKHGPSSSVPGGVERLTVETTSGTLLPVLVAAPTAEARDFTIVLHPEGKTAALDLDVSVQASGAGCLYPDLWGMGEVPWHKETSQGRHHDLARACLWLGRTLMGEWVKGVLLMREVLATEFGASSVSVHAVGELGLVTLCAAAIADGFKAIHLDGCPGSLCFGSKPTELSLGVHVPGFLKWGDVSLAAALTDSDLTLARPVRMDSAPYDQAAAQALEQEIQALRTGAGLPGTVRVTP